MITVTKMQNYRQVFANIVTLFTLSVAELLYVLHLSRSTSPGAYISHTKSKTTYAQIELSLESFPRTSVCSAVRMWLNSTLKTMAAKAKSRILRQFSSTIPFPRWFRSYADRSGDRRSRDGRLWERIGGFANDRSSNGQLTNRLGMRTIGRKRQKVAGVVISWRHHDVTLLESVQHFWNVQISKMSRNRNALYNLIVSFAINIQLSIILNLP